MATATKTTGTTPRTRARTEPTNELTKELTNETGVWTDNKYGWRDVDLEGRVDIRRARGGGYALILPPPIDLR